MVQEVLHSKRSCSRSSPGPVIFVEQTNISLALKAVSSQHIAVNPESWSKLLQKILHSVVPSTDTQCEYLLRTLNNIFYYLKISVFI